MQRDPNDEARAVPWWLRQTYSREREVRAPHDRFMRFEAKFAPGSFFRSPVLFIVGFSVLTIFSYLSQRSGKYRWRKQRREKSRMITVRNVLSWTLGSALNTEHTLSEPLEEAGDPTTAPLQDASFSPRTNSRVLGARAPATPWLMPWPLRPAAGSILHGSPNAPLPFLGKTTLMRFYFESVFR